MEASIKYHLSLDLQSTKQFLKDFAQSLIEITEFHAHTKLKTNT